MRGKPAKRRQRRRKRAGFEEAARLAGPSGTGNRFAATVRLSAKLTERCCSTIKKEGTPLPTQRGFFLYDREFQSIRKYQPYRLQATQGHQNRLLAPAVQAHIADRKDDVRMVYHILVPFPQTVLRIVCLQHRLFVAPLCDGKVTIPQGFRPPHRLRRLWRVAALHSCRVVLASPKNNL